MGASDISTINVRFRGVRGSIPAPGIWTARYGGNTSCVELRAGNEILILDAGSGIRDLGDDLMREFGEQPIEATVLISHTHWDHIQGLPFFAPIYQGRNRIRLLAAKGSLSRLERAMRNQMRPIHFPVDLSAMHGLASMEQLSSDQVSLGSLAVSVTALNHPGGCAGFRIAARGRSIAYLPDHEPYQRSMKKDRLACEEKLIEFARGADLLILDTQYTALEYPQRIGWGHGCLPDSVALALAAKVRRLLFFHHDPSHRDHQIDEMIMEARRIIGAAPLVVEAASESQPITLSGTIASVAA
jgi:phosphoribosyl 1,2-cyclic phosphodiesterase